MCFFLSPTICVFIHFPITVNNNTNDGDGSWCIDNGDSNITPTFTRTICLAPSLKSKNGHCTVTVDLYTVACCIPSNYSKAQTHIAIVPCIYIVYIVYLAIWRNENNSVLLGGGDD